MKDMKQTSRTLDKVLKFFLIPVKIAIVIVIIGLCTQAPFLFWSGPAKRSLVIAMGILAICLFTLYAARRILNGIRAILAPIIDGTPFHAIVGQQLKQLTRDLCILGILVNAAGILINLLLAAGEPDYAPSYRIDLSFLIYAGFIHLLGQIFEYGAELQQLSDETL